MQIFVVCILGTGCGLFFFGRSGIGFKIGRLFLCVCGWKAAYTYAGYWMFHDGLGRDIPDQKPAISGLGFLDIPDQNDCRDRNKQDNRRDGKQLDVFLYGFFRLFPSDHLHPANPDPGKDGSHPYGLVGFEE